MVGVIGVFGNILWLELVDFGMVVGLVVFLGVLVCGLLVVIVCNWVGYLWIVIMIFLVVIMVFGLYMYWVVYNLGL